MGQNFDLGHARASGAQIFQKGCNLGQCGVCQAGACGHNGFRREAALVDAASEWSVFGFRHSRGLDEGGADNGSACLVGCGVRGGKCGARQPECGEAQIGFFQLLKVCRNESDLGLLACEGCNLFAERAESEESRCGRLNGAWLGRRLGTGNLNCQIQLVRSGECPSFDAARTEVGGEFRSESMQGQDALGGDIFHMPEEVVIARMVGEREGGIATHAVDGTGIHCPTGDCCDAASFHQCHGFASGTGRRADENMASGGFDIPRIVFRKNDALGFIDRHELGDGRVEHDPQSCAAQVSQDFLGFPERVSEQNRRCAFLERFDAKFQDLSHHLLKRREHIARQAICGLHDERLGAGVGGCLGAGSLAELEVAGVEEAALVGLHETLGGSEDMASREQVHAELFKIANLAEGQGNRLAVEWAHSRFHEAKGRGGGYGALMTPGMVAVGVRNKRQRFRVMRIQPQIWAGQVDGASVPNLDHAVYANSSSLCPSVCGRIVPMVKKGYDPQGDLSPQ